MWSGSGQKQEEHRKGRDMAKTREEIEVEVESRVEGILHGWSGVDPEKIGRKSNLKTRCGISDELKPSLAKAWSQISQSYGGKKVSMKEAGNCDTVGDVIDTIMSKIPEDGQ